MCEEDKLVLNSAVHFQQCLPFWGIHLDLGHEDKQNSPPPPHWHNRAVYHFKYNSYLKQVGKNIGLVLFFKFSYFLYFKHLGKISIKICIMCKDRYVAHMPQ